MTNQSERARIDSLLSGGKISELDHRNLVAALERTSTFAKLNLLINPFPKLTTTMGLIAGTIAILILATLGSKLAIYYPGALDFQVIGEGQRSYGAVELLIQNFVDVLSLTLAFYVAALVARQRNLRFIDFLSGTFTTRAPYAIFLIVLAALSPIFADLLPRRTDLQTAPVIVLAILGIGFLIWILSATYFAFKESAGLKGKALWLGFILSLVAAEAISHIANTLLLK